MVVAEEAAGAGGYITRTVGTTLVTETDGPPEPRVAVRDTVRCHIDDAEPPPIIRLHVVRAEPLTT